MSDPLLPPGEPTAPAPSAEPAIDPGLETAAHAEPEAITTPDAESAAEVDAVSGADEPGAEAGVSVAEVGAAIDAIEAVEAVESSSAPAAARPAVSELSPAACAARLAELFPALFKGQPKPLKLRIQADIQQRAPGVFTKKSLSAFLHRHTTTTGYLIALTQSGQRIDLDGAPAGALDEVHVQAAATELARRRGMHEARRAAEQAAHRAAEGEVRQARAAEDDARRERALLLRAFETSTLTSANFCALKRIAEPELDALLATARLEAAQRAQDGWGEPRHDRQGPGANERPHDGPRGRPQDYWQDRRPDQRQGRPQNQRPDVRNEPRADNRPQDARGPAGRPPGRGPRPEGEGPRPEGQGPRRPAGPPKQPR